MLRNPNGRVINLDETGILPQAKTEGAAIKQTASSF